MNGRGGLVLVVDDDADVVDAIRFVLEENGYEVATAGHGRIALEIVAAHRPALILLDMKMPVMDGAAFATELRRRYANAPPIVVLTATDDARKRALDIGAAGWLGKPFDIDELVRTVATHLDRAAGGAHAAAGLGDASRR